MLIFNDEPGQWPYMRKHEDQLEFYCHGTRDFDVIDERWWYIAIAHCGGDGITNFKYNINMTNGKTAFDNHFSADERYILQTDIVFLGIYLMICGCLLKFRNLMIEQRMLNVTYRLFSYSCYLQTISLLFQTIAYGMFAYDGTGVERLRKLGEMISSTSTLLFVLLLILVAKGYTVTRARLRSVTSIKIGVFTCCYFFIYFGLYALQEVLYDPRDVVNKYDSFAGLGIVIMHVIGLFWMYYACFFTIKHNHSKAMFYILFIIIFTTWFLATPITIWMSTGFIAKWQRAKIVNGMELFTIFNGHMVFLLLTRPAANNRYFPFHLKTNTVGVINDVDNYDEENPSPPPSDFSSLFSATKAKYLTESESSVSLKVPSDGRLSTISQTIKMTNPTNQTDNVPDAAPPGSSPSGDVVKPSLPTAEASILPRGRFILVKAYVEE
ncbi:transmembrane protein 145-like [Anneissia japonica]|uniref:transmembrane protein 145-like n=1 Tax=Anneissia japonica TaxID=1529436 RepID=UPI0014255D32|nr:transmembrane protein 145-like [Anneissia japonica]